MSKPFKFRFVNEIAGGFVLLALALLLVGVITAGRAQGWFESEQLIYTQFPDEGAFGLLEGAGVEILGTVAGTVARIEPSPEGGMQAVLKIRQRFMTYVREGSEVLVKTRFGLGGDVFAEITRGRGAEFTGERITLTARKDTALVEMIEQKVEELQSSLKPILENVNGLLLEYQALAADMRSPTGEVQQAVARLNSILAKVDEGEGSAGKLLNDPATAREVLAILEGVNRSVGEVEGALVNVREATRRLPAMADRAPPLLDEAERTLVEARRLLEGVQRHWLVRGSMEPAVSEPEFLKPSLLDDALEGGR